jgi:(S)-2-hydroxyglutarate dehydrogenase
MSAPAVADVVVVGAGIVGLATARALLAARPQRSVVVVDKELGLATHQSGHNSGVIHSGIYYKPGGAKATMVRSGRAELLEFCTHHRIPVERCGKVIVAIDPRQLVPLDVLAERAEANGIAATRLGPGELAEHEPHARGLAALHVPSTAIVSFPAVCAALRRDLEAAGAQFRLGFRVDGLDETSATITLHDRSTDERIVARQVVNCAGLHSDRLAAMAGADTAGVRIMAFRGEYYELVAHREHLCRTLIYPVPDPNFPFLGVHLTRMIDGSVHAGPNAVPALSREGYSWRAVNAGDVRELVTNPATYRLARRYWRTGAGEIHRSLRKAAFVRALQALCPELNAADLVRSSAGVRAQAIGRDGRLLDDFAFATTERTVHVVNAPSPAATASFAIGRAIARRLDGDPEPLP